MNRLARCACLFLLMTYPLHAAESTTNFFSNGEKSKDYRLGDLKTLNGKFPMQVPESKEAWEVRKNSLREQVLVATGLWPMPEKTPLNPTIHSKIDQDGYTIEKVFFASYPGFYVTGNLYRPKGFKGKRPGVLCPHGHWSGGRFYDAGEKAGKKKIEGGEEQWVDGARNHIQARCAGLARLGCVVFNYDMIGYADSQQIAHRQGFTDAEAALRLQNFFGVQTWNSIRALDFLMSLPDVDQERIGVTGASGGGTQTFILCGIDPRPTVAFPAVMVSTAMQGGCICENCSYLRQDAGNIDLAALIAPRPLAMTGARDWTIDIEKKGLPELKQVYGLYNAEDKVLARCFPQFGHNYNQVSRAVMYQWFNKHLGLNQESVKERPFKFFSQAELTVFDKEHPRPKDSVNAGQLRKYLTKQSNQQINVLKPKTQEDVVKFRKIIGTALRVMIGSELPTASQVETKAHKEAETHNGIEWHRFLIGRTNEEDQVPGLGLIPEKHNGSVVIWVHPKGKSSLMEKGQLHPEAKKLLTTGSAILAIDTLETGEQMREKPMSIDKRYVGYTFGYNRPLVSNRVHDILTAVGFAKKWEKTTSIQLRGFKEAGPWVLLARGLCGDAVDLTIADGNQFSFGQVKSIDHPMMLPGALKYGDLGALASLAAPGKLKVYNFNKKAGMNWLQSTYKAAGQASALTIVDNQGDR